MTGIEWATATWNPWHGCRKVSAGCKNCYMYREKARYGQDPMTVVRGKTTFKAPLKWKEPERIFTCSWSDWFIGEADAWRDEAWEIIRQTPHHTYMILTKRPERIANHLPDDWGHGYPNVWMGVSVENQEAADERIPLLMQVPAVVRFLSCEPLLGPVDLTQRETCPDCRGAGYWWTPGPGPSYVNSYGDPPRHKTTCETCGGDFNSPGEGEVSQFPIGLHWVIVGSESGPNRRYCNLEWVRSIRDQCTLASVPFFLKQLHVGGKKVGTLELDGRTWADFPEVRHAV